MQNKTISLIVLVTFLLGTGAMAQEAKPNAGATGSAQEENSLGDFSAGISQKKTVDFPARSSLDTMELATLPGVNETNMTGPQPMAESISANDTPSEQLLGRLTPEIFQEMAELERDNAYLKLQIQKEQMKNDLENARAQYRQARLDEIAKREDVVRTRIQWWQEQEKLRQEVEKERQEAEEIKNKMAEAEAMQAQLAAEAEAAAEKAKTVPVEEVEEVPSEEEEPDSADATLYSLVNVKGTRGNLVARIKNTTNDETKTVKVGDNLDGEIITAITPEAVIVDRDGVEYAIKFPNQ